MFSQAARPVHGVRVLGPRDLPALRRLLATDPLVNVFVADRVDSTGLDQRWLGGRVYGYEEDGELVACCHHAANLVPVDASPAAIEAFAARALDDGRTCASVFGPAEQVLALWDRLEPSWGPAREVRREQPFLVCDDGAQVAGDPQVRRVRVDELDLIYPASVAMFTEEVGVSPEADGRDTYRARVAALVAQGRVFARIEDGTVLFKAEVGSLSEQACQVQGVYVDKGLRGRGLGTAGVATVVDTLLREGMPAVTLYVNGDNEPARRAYAKVGFVRTGTFATVLI